MTSQTQLDDLQRALEYPKLRDRINPAQVHDFVANIDVMAIVVAPRDALNRLEAEGGYSPTLSGSSL